MLLPLTRVRDARDAGIQRVVHVSSTAVYGIPDHHPLLEDEDVRRIEPEMLVFLEERPGLRIVGVAGLEVCCDAYALLLALIAVVCIVALTALLMGVLMMGLLSREKQGPAGIGWEGILIITLFLGGYAVLYAMG